jgi:hypothetical protein
LQPGDFWRQTPRTLALILEGRRKAAEQALELAMFGAWQTARMSSYSKKLEPLKHYLDELRPRKMRRQTPEEMIAALRAIKSGVMN